MQELKALLKQLSDRERTVKRWLIAAGIGSFLVFLMTVALQYQITSRNKNIDEVQLAVNELNIAVNELNTATHNIEEVQKDIQQVARDAIEVTPDEEAQNDAVARVLRQVPEIREILCEAFPGSSPCSETPTP